jgi:hypothetical protein
MISGCQTIFIRGLGQSPSKCERWGHRIACRAFGRLPESEASDGPLPFPARRYLEVAFVHYRHSSKEKRRQKGIQQILVANAKPLTLEN